MLKNSFQGRIVAVLSLLLFIVIGSLYFAVKAATRVAVESQASKQLEVGARVFERLLDMRGRQLRDAVQVLAADFGFKDAVTSGDTPTIRSVLANQGARIGASDMLLLSLDGHILASTIAELPEGELFPYSDALIQARDQGQSMVLVPLQHLPHLLVETPVMAPIPVARVVTGFEMDQALALELRSLSNLEVSFLAIENEQPGKPASTLPAELQGELAEEMRDGGKVEIQRFGTQRYLSQPLTLARAKDYRIVALLQSPLNAALMAFAPLDKQILLIALVALFASLVGAVLLARSVSQPVRRLAAAAERIGQGDYQAPLALQRNDELGRLAEAFGQMQADLAERERQLAHNALHDPLTGVGNRTLILERLGSAITAARPMAMIHLGIGNFRAVNESCGTKGGDQALQQLARRLQATLHPGDSLARLVADEFLILLDGYDSDAAVAAADKLQQLLFKPLNIGNVEVALDCRFGIAAYPRDGLLPEELLLRAGIAMQDAAQLSGRLQVYQEGRDDEHKRQIALIRDLRQAPQKGELLLHFQPKLDLRNGSVHQAEALLRWQHPQYGMVSPGEFIPLAERTGSVQGLTAWVINESLRQLGEWNARGLRVLLSLNISAEDLLSIDLAERVSNLLQRYQVPAEQVIFEITESAVMQDPEFALMVLNSLRSCGISLSVDDFGTGYSSLAHLKRLPVQELKIDQSFIRELDETSEDAVIVRSTIEMSHRLGLKVVAEGVEYERSLRLLERWQCDIAQGYLISRPLTAVAFEAWVAQPLRPSLVVVR